MGAAEALEKLTPAVRETVLVAHALKTTSPTKVGRERGTTTQTASEALLKPESVSALTQLTAEDLDRGRGELARLQALNDTLLTAVEGLAKGQTLSFTEAGALLKLVSEQRLVSIRVADQLPPVQDRPLDWAKDRKRMIRRAARLGALMVKVERGGGEAQPPGVGPIPK